MVDEAFKKIGDELKSVMKAPPNANAKLFDAASYRVRYKSPTGEEMLADLFSVIRSNVVSAKKKGHKGRKKAKVRED